MPETLSTYFVERKERGRPGLPVYSVTLEKGLVPRDSLDRRTESALDDDAHALVEPGDIAYNMMRMWQGALGVANSTCLVSPAYVVMRPRPNVDVRFAAAWMKSERGLNRLWAYSHGITDDRLRLYADDFLSIPVEFPPPDEQRRIAAVLDTWDDAIDIAERLIDQVRCRNEMINVKVFGAGGDQLGKLRDLADVIRGVGYNPQIDVADDVCILTAAHIQGGEVDFAQQTISVRHERVGDLQYLRTGDIVVCMSNGSKHLVGKTGSVRHVPSPSAMGAFCATCRPKDKFSGRLLRHALASLTYKEFLNMELAGSAIGNLSPTSLADFQFRWCGQASAIDTLDEVAAELYVQQQMAALLRRQKRGLMQKLLTGEWRVPATGDAFVPGGPAADRLDSAA